LVEVVTDQIEH